MLTQIDVVYEDETGVKALALPVIGLRPKNSLLLRSVTGLNPPDIDLFIGDYARDGGIYQGRRVGARHPVMVIQLNPNPALGETLSGWRNTLYKIFNDPLVDADHLQLILRDDDAPDRHLVGYVEKFETEIFSEETLMQVSMTCPDPYIKDLVETVMEPPSEAEGWFTVPPFPYNGTAETGFEVEMHFSGSSSVLTLENNSRVMVINHSFVANNVVYINTNRGARDILMTTTSSLSSLPQDWDAMETYSLGDEVVHEGQLWEALVNNPSDEPEGDSAEWRRLQVWNIEERWKRLVELDLTTPLIAKLRAQDRWLELHSNNNVMTVYGATTASRPATIQNLSFRPNYWGI